MGKKKQKWHRVHFFRQEKKRDAENRKIGKEHPAYIFEQSPKHYKAIIFTSHPTTDGEANEKMKHNVDPLDTTRTSYGVYYRGARPFSDFRPPDKAYRIHKDDMPTVKKLKAGRKKKK